MNLKFKAYLFFLLALQSIFFSCRDKFPDNRIRIGFAQAMTNDDWRRSMNNSMKLQASLNPNISLTIYDANYDVEKQIKQLESLIADSLDIIIVSPIQSKPITPVVQKALKLGIPVLVVDRKTEDEKYTSYLGADNIEVGRNAAKEIIASNSKDSISIIEIRGLKGSSPAKERTLGFHQIIDQYNYAEVKAEIEGDWEKESIQNKLKALLTKGVFPNYIFAHNDRMAIGAWEVARDLGIEKSINIIGVDGLSGVQGGIQAVKNGILQATILYPTGGDEAIKLALKILNKESVPKNNLLSTTIINKLNADIMNNQFEKIKDQQAEMELQLDAIKKQKELYYSQNNLLKLTMSLLAVVLSLAIYSIYSIFAIRKKNRQLELTNDKITVQRNQIEKIAEEVKVSNEAKLNFFTGLSHEFKTPITLILSSIESMSEFVKERGSNVRNEVELIYNNSNRLLRLINQLLDFRKIEDRKFNLKASKTNLYGFSKIIFKDFEREAKKRNIDFKLNSNNKDLDVFIDRNLMDKVYFNLLSNAFKFTPDNGKIEIDIEDDVNGNKVNIRFNDSGIGIPAKDMDGVFQAFFQGSNNNKNSSGIGLHLSKEFVEMHKGTIQVKSIHGAEFSISLYKGQAHFNETEIVTEQDLVDTNIIDFTSEHLMDDNYLLQTPSTDNEKYSVLIIEDNRDLSLFLKNKLQIEYEIHLSDGTDVIEKAFEVIPDIILCDINLPDKNGFEICELLKKDLRTSHIPTIILTALGNKESYLKGLQSGADLYLTKPFSYAILVQSIKSLLYNREKLRYYYTSNIHKIEEIGSFGNIEQQFVSKLNTLINDNLGNSDYSVEHLAENLNISRVQLYRKVKAMMGISISDYIGNIRLEKAKLMLETSTLTVAEIAYANGYSSPNYFSTTFKNKYGTSPAAFRKSI
ncbi:substrate-binding domain-containing protein [Aurantibacter crassamenti]|uniref:hybrid sensor histidine kinase/response regulator transcription factor n=1 Tax=Aurantibacter crassamenti TaxID=1837375 RepID=UPI0019398A7D|nr:substrate-binding domain-containing protein [Aurantibacter crassamenti]MBM1105674.1 substrate-binding domain-containing protein [Aurantibacter crassamenti]